MHIEIDKSKIDLMFIKKQGGAFFVKISGHSIIRMEQRFKCNSNDDVINFVNKTLLSGTIISAAVHFNYKTRKKEQQYIVISPLLKSTLVLKEEAKNELLVVTCYPNDRQPEILMYEDFMNYFTLPKVNGATVVNVDMFSHKIKPINTISKVIPKIQPNKVEVKAHNLPNLKELLMRKPEKAKTMWEVRERVKRKAAPQAIIEEKVLALPKEYSFLSKLKSLISSFF